MMNGEFESTRNELTGKIYGQKARTVIDHLEARHRVHSPTMAMRASCARAACSARPVRGFSTASTNLLSVRAAVGSRLKEVDNAKSTEADMVLQYQQTLSGLRDLD